MHVRKSEALDFEMRLIETHAQLHIITCVSDSRRGFGLAIRFIDHLYTRLGTTRNYNSTANLHNSQITTAPAKPFPAVAW
jgi:hypothetical protein